MVAIPAELVSALERTGCAVEMNAPLARRVFWRTGGAADVLVEAASAEQVAAVQHVGKAHDAAITMVGAGSNVLISDAGIRGVTLTMSGALTALDVIADDGADVVLRAGAGLKLAVFFNRLVPLDVGGFGALVGVPGTIGGAVRMNAGTSLGWTSDFLESITVALDGQLLDFEAAALAMRYRWCALPEGAIVTAATLRGHRRDRDADRAANLAHLEHRKRTQPLDKPSCGSVFTNPDGDHAGRLVEAAGLKGHRIGDAQISDLHANFIVNLGQASADDVLACIRLAWETVGAQFGVWMRPEVELLGEWSDQAWPLVPPPEAG